MLRGTDARVGTTKRLGQEGRQRLRWNYLTEVEFLAQHDHEVVKRVAVDGAWVLCVSGLLRDIVRLMLIRILKR